VVADSVSVPLLNKEGAGLVGRNALTPFSIGEGESFSTS